MRMTIFMAGLFMLVASSVASATEGRLRSTSYRVVDGDTIHLMAGGVVHKVRLNGIDAVEKRQHCVDAMGHSWACGQVATDVLAGILESSKVGVECLISDKPDRYKRLIGICYASGIDVQRALVRAGLAVAEYSDDYREDEIAAHKAKRGIWSGEFIRPKQWRKQKRG